MIIPNFTRQDSRPPDGTKLKTWRHQPVTAAKLQSPGTVGQENRISSASQGSVDSNTRFKNTTLERGNVKKAAATEAGGADCQTR